MRQYAAGLRRRVDGNMRAIRDLQIEVSMLRISHGKLPARFQIGDMVIFEGVEVEVTGVTFYASTVRYLLAMGRWVGSSEIRER